MKAAKTCFGVYFLFVLLDQFFIWTQMEELRWLAKPLLMPLLLLAIFSYNKPPTVRPVVFILAALFFSWCGDMLLQAKGFFIPGLSAFLLAHVSYVFYFLQVGKEKKGLLHVQPLVAIPVLLYILLLLAFLIPHLGELTAPVIFYSLAIGTMLLLAVNTRRQISPAVSAYFMA